MHTLFLTPALAPLPKLEGSFPPPKSKPFVRSRLISSSKLSPNGPIQSSNPAQLSIVSRDSACDEISLLDDWPRLLQISLGSGDFLLGQATHAFLLKLGHQNEAFQGNNIINLYAKFNRMDVAQRLFDEMPVRNAITWTSLMKGYSEINDVESVFLVARKMLGSGEIFNKHTCSVILQACSLQGRRLEGEQIHGFLIKCGFEGDVFVGTSLVSMYSRSGSLSDAEKVFEKMDRKDVRCLNFMISEYGDEGCGQKALQCFLNLLQAGLEPNHYTFTGIISASNEAMSREEGRQLHCLAIKYGCHYKTSVENALISMYGNYGLLEDSERVFIRMVERNLISWTALFSGYVKNGHGQKALAGFLEIIESGVCIDCKCLPIVLDGCSECSNMELGRQVHGMAVKYNYCSNENVGTALIDLYAKSGDQRSARLIFNSLCSQITASFNAVLGGFMRADGEVEEHAISLLSKLRFHGLVPDAVTFALLIRLSADQASLFLGRSLHCYAYKSGLENNYVVGNSAITMYAKCGCIDDAYQIFEGMTDHDSISWNAIISAYALHGQGEKALLLFENMKEEGYSPDEITILAVLQACNYSGLWSYGICLYDSMEKIYGIKPVLEHFACMVDILGRSGQLRKAMDFINDGPYSDSPLLWRTLVHACKLQQDLNFGTMATKQLLDLSHREAGSYILVSNMYAGNGMLDEAAKVRTVMNDMKVSKELGCSWIEIDRKVCWFGSSSQNHPDCREIHLTLDLLRGEMKGMHNDGGDDIQLLVDPD